MKKRLFLLALVACVTFVMTAGILTTKFLPKQKMIQMIELLYQKKIEKMTFPKNDGPNYRSSSSIHENSSNSVWRFDYVKINENEILQIRFFDFGSDDNDVSRLVSTIKKYGKSNDDGFCQLCAHMYMYDKEGSMIVSMENMSICTSTIGVLEAVWIFLNMDKDGGWNDFLDKHDISRIRVVYGNNSYNLKLVDYNSPYSTIEQIRQLSFWVTCPESQLIEIGKQYDVWLE